jgi:RND family efflux transporter MFP subunit
MNRTVRPPLPLLALLALTACGGAGDDAAPAAPPTPVRVAPVEARPIGDTVRGIGTLTPRDEARLAFKIGGVIERIAVDAGQPIRAGQQLAWLRQTEVEAGVRQATEAADKARRDLDRGRALFEDGVATEEQLQDLTTAASVAGAALDAARFNARFARIVAPADGVVLRRLAEPDELVAPGQPVLIVGGTRRGWVVKVAVPDRDVVRLTGGDRARVELDAFPGRVFDATVTNIGSAADPLTGTFEVELGLAADEPRFAQGMVARASLAGAGGRTALVVPVTALIEADDRRAFVYVVDAQATRARRVAVHIGRLDGDQVELVSGLAAGARVVVDGAAFLHDGASVRVSP